MSDVIDKRQKLLIEFMIADVDVLIKCIRIIKPEYFESPLDKVIKEILDYFEKHHGKPCVDTIEAQTGVSLKEREVDESEISFVLEELEEFCQEMAMTNAILEAVDHINEGNRGIVMDLIKEAQRVKIDQSIGTSLFHNPQERIENTDANVERINIGLPPIDDLTGGSGRGELGIFYAATGVGKSVTLANVSRLHAIDHKHDVLIITLELYEDLYSKRLDSIVTGSDIKFHKEKAEDIASTLIDLKDSSGDITSKRLPYRATPTDVRAVVMEYHLERGKYPDVLIVDYLTLMGSHMKGAGKFEEHEYIAFSLREIAAEFNMFAYTAGQINREGQDVIDLSPAHCAGGISVINASDWSISMSATLEDLENNQLQVGQLKVRNSGKVTSKPILYKNPHNLRLSDKPFDLTKDKKHSSPIPSKTKTKDKKESERKKTEEKLTTGSGKDKLRAALKLSGVK